MTRVGTRTGPRTRAVVSKPDGYGPDAYFTTAAEFTAKTAITPAAMYLGLEASGSRADVLGGTALAANGAPSYQKPVGDALGIEYPTTSFGAGHRADVNAPGVALSFWVGGFARVGTPYGGLPGFFGRSNAGFTQCWAVYQQGSFLGTSVLIRDGLGSSLLLGSAFGYLVPDQTYFIQVQVDRAAAECRALWSPIGGGPRWSGSGSIAGFGTLSGAGQTFGMGSFCNAVSNGNAVGRVVYATGAQVEGASILDNMAAALGVE